MISLRIFKHLNLSWLNLRPISARFSIKRHADLTTFKFMTRMFCLETVLTFERIASSRALACLNYISSVNCLTR